MNYFANLFLSSKPSDREIDMALENICPKVNESMNALLTAPFTESEIHKALFEMHPSKAPGPDGFTALFFQKQWTRIGKKWRQLPLKF